MRLAILAFVALLGLASQAQVADLTVRLQNGDAVIMAKPAAGAPPGSMKM